MTAAGNPGLGESWHGRRVLVTGATGLVGSWVVKELLEQGALVIVLVQDRDPRSELIRSGDSRHVGVVDGALEDFHTVERAVNLNEVEIVLHLGAQTIVGAAHGSPLQTFEANVRGTYNVLEACRLHAPLVEGVVVASSDKAYGESPDLPYTERSPLLGRHPYEVSKTCADLIAQSYHHTYRLPVAIARCGNVYGGGDLNWSRLVPGTIRSFLRGERPVTAAMAPTCAITSTSRTRLTPTLRWPNAWRTSKSWAGPSTSASSSRERRSRSSRPFGG